MLLEHLSPKRWEPAELFAWVASIVVGVAGVWLLPIKRLPRALLTIPYVPTAAWMTLTYWLGSVCSFYGACL
jgi:hypothetical protein